MEEELRSGIETLKDISEGAVPPEISIEEAKAILKRYKKLEEDNKELVKNNYRLTNELENKRKEYQETYKDVREELKELKNDIKLQKIFNKKLIETSIPTSVVQNKKKEEREKCVARFRYGNDEAPLESYKYKYTDIDMNEYAGSEIIRVLQEILEEGRK